MSWKPASNFLVHGLFEQTIGLQSLPKTGGDVVHELSAVEEQVVPEASLGALQSS